MSANRLAGATFAYNVRFDHLHAESIKKTPGNIDDECLDIKPYEILVSRTAPGRPHGKRTNVYSNATTTKDQAKDIRFMGVAATSHKYEKHDMRIDQGLVANVAGIVTVQNNSNKNIYPGQLLVLGDEPAKSQEKGIHVKKEVFQFVPLDSVEKTRQEKWVKETMEKLDDNTTFTAFAAIGDAEKNKLREALEKQLKDYVDQRPRVVAKALEFSKKNTKMDILLHPCQM